MPGRFTVSMMVLAFTPGLGMVALLYTMRSTLINTATLLSDSFLMGLISKEERGLADSINSIVDSCRTLRQL